MRSLFLCPALWYNGTKPFTEQENHHAQGFTGRSLRPHRFYPHRAPACPGRGVFVCLRGLRLAPLKEERGNCPFLTGNHCAIHDAEPLVCALYPLAQEITKDGQVSYFLQPTQCGGQVIAARVGDYLARYDVPAREATDVRWAQVCMELEDTVERLEALFEPVFARRMQEKLWQALYYRYDFAKEYRPQLEENLLWLDGELKKLEGMQMRHRAIEKSDR